MAGCYRERSFPSCADLQKHKKKAKIQGDSHEEIIRLNDAKITIFLYRREATRLCQNVAITISRLQGITTINLNKRSSVIAPQLAGFT